MKSSFVSPILMGLARRAGVRIVLEPRFGYAGQIILRDGRRKYFKGTNFDINPLGSSMIAQDKDYAAFFMRAMGYPVPEGEAFFTSRWDKKVKQGRGPLAAYAYARTLGFPVVIKPNHLSQGSGVNLVFGRAEFFRAFKEFEERERVFLVQRHYAGHDYRIVVLDDRVISAYERLPLSVVGDGKSTIRQLMEAKQRRITKQGRDTLIDFADRRITRKLKRKGYDRGSVPKANELVELLDNKNLSTGGDAIDITDKLHNTVTKLAVNVTRDMGLRFCGVDLITARSLDQPLGDYVILEINAAPGLDHYASVGKKQKAVVDEMYLHVLNAMTEE